MHTYTMTINGESAPTEASFEVVNPATGAAFATAPGCTRHQLDAAMDSALKAQRDWREDESARRRALVAAADALVAAVEAIAPVLTAEQGKPLVKARAEVLGAAAWLRYYAGVELAREVIQDDDRALVEVLRRPLGVVAAIAPWNFPVLLAAWKIAPALLAGNAVVLKPSPFTPLATLLLGEVLRPALPPGVLNVVSGGDELGAWMTSHPVPRKISFTGSTETGKLVAAAAAPDLKRLTLELGGNDAAILLDDLDVASVADRLFWAAFDNNGQFCSAVKRLYVPERRHDEVVDALAALAASVRVGDGTEEATVLGPVNNAPQYRRVGDLVAEALAGGARPAAGGAPLDRSGYFFAPTILTKLAEGTRVVDEEQFGPVLPVIAYRHLDDAVERANATTFGLAGSVWGSDADEAAAVAGRLECGTAWVNTHGALAPHQPFGGHKWSGVGVENGRHGLESFSEIQVRHHARV